MNKISLMAVCAISIALTACQEKPATTCIGEATHRSAEPWMSDYDKYFMLSDFSKYVGKSVATLEKELAYKYSGRAGITKENNELIGMSYSFASSYTITVSFKKLSHTTYNEKRKQWDFSRIGKETISGVNVTHSGGGNFYFCKDFGEIRI